MTLTVLGQKNASATDTRIHLDFIDVWDGTAMDTGTFEHTSDRVFRSSNWSLISEIQASGGSYIRAGSNVWFPFTGDTVTYQAWASNSGGTVEVLVDGTVRETISLQFSTASLRAWTFSNLGAGPHLLQVRTVAGTSNVDTFTLPGHAHGTAPTNLRVLSTTESSITLAWDAATAAAGIADYDVTAGSVLIGTTSGTSFTVNNLLPGTTYPITVQARDTAGNLSPSSLPLMATTSGTPVQVTLTATITPEQTTTDERVFDLVIEARDENGTLVTNYRGAIDILSTAGTVGLPQSAGADYTFTTGDGGRKIFSGFSFTDGGSHTITINDRHTPELTATSNTVFVQAVRLIITTNPTTVFAGEPALTVTVEAHDDAGNLVPGYRGIVTFSSSSAMSGLPMGGLGGSRYTFTAGDAGRHVWTGVTLNTVGTHAITVGDGIRTGTSNPVAVQVVSLAITVSPTTVFAGEPVLQVLVTAQDANGDPVPGYRGTVRFSSSSAMSGLPMGGLGGSTYTFTAADAGQHAWTGVTLNTPGEQTITVSDGTRQATSTPMTVLAVTLEISLNATMVYAGEPVLSVLVSARDQNGDLVPGYRGQVTFSSTSSHIGLPVGGLGGIPYTFTAADAGQHAWTGVTLNTPGEQTITVGDGFRQATSTPMTVLAVTLEISISPTTVYAGERILSVIVAARDQQGNLVPGYRGGVTFTSTSNHTGLPVGGLGGIPYTFTADDAGRHAWTGVMLSTTGDHTITVSDGFRQATSVSITVREVFFNPEFSPAESYINDQTLSLAITAVNDAGQPVTGYQGEIDLNPSVPMRGLPQSPLNTPDYVFTPEDAGQHVFSGLAFTEEGEHSVTMIDRANPGRQATSNSVATGIPPAPTPLGAQPQPNIVTIPANLPAMVPPPIPLGCTTPPPVGGPAKTRSASTPGIRICIAM